MAFFLRGLAGRSGILGAVGDASAGLVNGVTGTFSSLFGALGGSVRKVAGAAGAVASGLGGMFSFLTSPVFLIGVVLVGGGVAYMTLTRGGGGR